MTKYKSLNDTQLLRLSKVGGLVATYPKRKKNSLLLTLMFSSQLLLIVPVAAKYKVNDIKRNTKSIELEKRRLQATYTIKGRVVSTDQTTIPFATVRVMKSGDQKVVSTSISDNEGRFSVVVNEKGVYLLSVSSIEMKPTVQEVIVANEPTVQLSDIVLFSSVKELNSVTITSKRPLVIQEADRIVYDVQADSQNTVYSVLDMMRKVPYLSLDGEGKILFKGSSSYKVFINGKPSAMVERNPTDVLRSIPASTIKSIEVITTPPSKYDAEGLAGIINIITKKEIANGYHGSFNISGKAPEGGLGTGGGFTFKEGKLGVSTFAGISRNDVPRTIGATSRTTTGISETQLKQHNTTLTNSHTGYAGLEASYELDSLNLISGQLNWSSSRSTGLATQSSALTGAVQQNYSLSNDRGNEGRGLDVAAHYQLGFQANKNQLLTVSYRYLKSENSLMNTIDLFDQFNQDNNDYRQLNAESLAEQTAQIDYVHPIKNLTIEAGLKGIFRTNKSDFQFRNLNPLTNDYELDLSRSNVFDNTQDVLAVYNSYNYQAVNWQFKAGIRAEQTIINGIYSENTTQLKQKYLNVVPAIVVNKKFKDRSSLSFSFSKRIQRPAISQLNPFVDRSNPDFETTGNPHLRPITSDSYNISYLKSSKGTVNISIGHFNFSRLINPFSTYDPSSNVTVTRFENNGKGHVWKTNIYIRYPILDNWDVVYNGDLRHVVFYGMVNNITVRNSGVDFYSYASTGFTFKKGWRANMDFTYKKSGILLPLGKTNGFTASSFTLNKNLMQEKLTLSAAVSNPFSKFRYIEEQTFGQDFLQTNDRQVYYRKFTVSLNYRFGKLKEEIKKNKRGIKNDDLSN